MRVVAKTIEVVAWFGEKGEINPVRFRIKDDEERFQVIKIDKIMKRDTEKLAGNIMEKFTCSSIIGGVERIFEIKYERSTYKWMLFKI
ncbi:hypothetical protein [Clostridium sp. LP20]|uniref:hypothetical protein n=1 Tax=Clostridium sp. LP20 TaxID=3418665 RepID=UPI003EE65D27